jgi:regulator of sigma E protease
MPAAKAGVLAGDQITAVNGRPVTRWEDLSQDIRESDGGAVVLTLLRDGAEKTISVVPERTDGRTIFGEPMPIYVIGVEPSDQIITERSNPLMAVWQGVARRPSSACLTVVTIVKLFQAVVPASNLGGPLMIMKMAGEQAHQGLPALLYFMAILSINLGVLNLLPIPILDGGHLLFMGIEKVLVGRSRSDSARSRSRSACSCSSR